MRRTIAALVLLVGLFTVAATCRAGDFGLTDKSRWSVSASSAWLGIRENGTGWQGVDIAPALTFSVHQSLALAGNYAYGIPFDKTAGHRNIARVQGQLRIFPTIGSESGKVGLFASAGPSWVGEWSGLNTQLAATREISTHFSIFGMYAHGFAWDEAVNDLDFYRVGLNVGTTLGR